MFYDQRSHGKSARAPEGHSHDGLPGRPTCSSVIATAAPTGPVVLIGHSMGGMAILTLAAQDPDLFAERVAGVGLVCTGATYLRRSELNQLLITGGNPVVRAVTSVAARYPAIFERGRATNRDAVWLLTRSLGFARKDVPGAMVDYLDEMISGDAGRCDRRVHARRCSRTTRPRRCPRWPASRRPSSPATRTG